MRLDCAASRALHAGLLALTVVAGAWLTLAELNLGRHGMVAVYVAQATPPSPRRAMPHECTLCI